jgi:alkaline phosphatase D
MAWTRRAFLEAMSAAGLAVVALPELGCSEVSGDGLPSYAWAGPPGAPDTFGHGVASGDPLQDAVLLWTRVALPEGVEEAEVFVEVAEDPDFASRLSAAFTTAQRARSGCLTVEATALAAGTTYFYRFAAFGIWSPVGRTRTLPAAPTTRARIAVCSCSNYAYGWFHAYRHMAGRADLDAVVHLGDYVYEYANDGFGETYGTLRDLEPPQEMVTLDDYRRRYAHYRRDPDLAEVHRQNPFIHVWDDHEFACDPFVGGASNHQPEDGDWEQRKASALQAYAEWMPTRLEGNRIYRHFAFGDLMTLLLVDRQRRYLWPEEDAGSLFLGSSQQAWLDALAPTITTPWTVVGSPSTFASRAPDGSGGGWGRDARRRFLDALAPTGSVPIVVVGDVHRFEALDIVDDPSNGYDPETGVGSEGVEIVAGSITSPGGGVNTDPPQVFWGTGSFRGYAILDVSPEEAAIDFFGFGDIFKNGPDLPEEAHLQGYRVTRTGRHLVPSDAPAAGRDDAPSLAPATSADEIAADSGA